MLARIFQFLLFVCALAMVLFLAGFLFAQTGMVFLAVLLFPLASKILLAAMSSLAVLAVLGVVLALFAEIRRYFGQDARGLRQVWSLHHKQLDFRRRQMSEWRQIRYKNHFKRQRLLMANNRKHLQALFQEVDNELSARKKQLPRTRYKALQKALRRSHKRGDAQSLLSVRGEIVCR